MERVLHNYGLSTNFQLLYFILDIKCHCCSKRILKTVTEEILEISCSDIEFSRASMYSSSHFPSFSTVRKL